MVRASGYLMTASALLLFSMGASTPPLQNPTPSEPPSGPALFAPLAADAALPRADVGANGGEVVRTEYVSMDLSLVDEPAFRAARSALDQGGAPPRFRLNLFGDVALSVTMDMLSRSEDGTLSWAGRVDGQKLSSVAIAVTGQVASGNFKTETGGFYQLRFMSPGVFAIREVDEGRFPPERQPIPVDTPPSPAAAPGADTGVARDDGSIMDVMVVYTPAARDAVGGVAQIENLINLAVTETNQGYANSGVIQRVRLAHQELINYTEYSDIKDDKFGHALSDITGTSDAFMTGVHALRNTYAADFVSLWINDATSCGLGWLMTTESAAFATNAFSVVHYGCATGYYSFAHEMGHNQGSGHDRANASVPGVKPYSYGYGQSSPVAFRTVMAYASSCANCTRINYWSNPTVTFGGSPTGVDGAFANSADNHRSLNDTRVTASNWRASLTPVTISIADASMNEGNTGSTLMGFTVTLSAAPSAPVTVDYATSAGTATPATDYTTRSGTLTFAAGQTSRHVLISVVGDTTVEPNENFNVTLSNPVGATIADGSGVGTILNDDAPPAASQINQYRLYSPITLEHLYTTDLNEYNVLGGQVGTWIQEGIGYKMLSSAGTFSGSLPNPFYRLYHTPSRQHHWTTDSNEVMVLAAQTNWSYEGITGFLLPTQVGSSVPLYRLVFPNPVIHLWTTDANEKLVLTTQRGWTYEGIPGYVIP